MADTLNPAIQHLIDQLHADDPTQRIAAADGLGQFAASNEDIRGLIEHGIPALVGVMQHDLSRDVRWAAAYALGALGDANALPALWQAYHADAEDTGLRLVIIKAVGKIEDKGSVVGLIEVMRVAESRCLRAAAQKAMQRIGAAHGAT